MAWNEFTAYLDGTRFIRKAERDEIYDAFEERAAAVALLTGVDYSAPSAVRNCGLITDFLERSAGSSPLRLEAAINAIAPLFGRPSVLFASTFTGTPAFTAGIGAPGAIFYDAAGPAGLTVAAAAEALASPLDDHRRWNLYRSALILMAHPQIFISVVNHRRKTGTEGYDPGDPSGADDAWADVKAEFAGATEVAEPLSMVPAYLIRQHTSNVYSLAGGRTVWTLRIPATPAFAANSHVFAAVQNDDNVPLTVTYQGGSSGVIGQPVYPTLKYLLFAGTGTTGDHDFDFRFNHYNAGAGLDALRPDPQPFSETVAATITTPLYGFPYWTKG